MGTLQLNLPTRTTSPGATPDLRPKAVQAWLAELPMAHAIEAGQQLLDRLGEINQAFVTPKARHAALEMIHPALHQITVSLQRTHRDVTFPLPAGHCLMTTLCQQLLEEMANGYKLVITDRLLEGFASDDLEVLTHSRAEPLLLRSLWRAMHYLGAQLLECYLIYASEPEGVWLDLHRLYQFAEQRLLHLSVIEAPDEDPPTPATLNDIYKRILLLALCNPYHLMQGESAALSRQLGHWSTAMKIVHATGVHTLAGTFVVDLDTDAPPRYIPPSRPLPTPAHCRLLDVSALLTSLDGHVHSLLGMLKDKQLRGLPTLAERREYDLYVRLKRSWEVRQDRRFARTVQLSSIAMVTGLSACHHYISAMAAFTPEEDEARLHELHEGHAAGADAASAPADAADEDSDPVDVWQKIYANAPARTRHRPAPTRDTAGFAVNPWQQRNSGRGGMAVFCVSDCRAHASVGDLVAYMPTVPRANDHWRMGVIRWLRTPDFASVELGIMALADAALAVATRAVRGPGSGGDYVRSLLITGTTGDSNTDMLLTPPTIYDEGTVLIVNRGDHIYKVKLLDLVEATSSYARFRFTLITQL